MGNSAPPKAPGDDTPAVFAQPLADCAPRVRPARPVVRTADLHAAVAVALTARTPPPLVQLIVAYVAGGASARWFL